ncbi:MAG TPA: hypothetical protein VIV12_07740 [Streptosporangiaceae bacterium]
MARRALEALTLRLDGTRAAAATITRKRAVLYNCLGYAVELGLLPANPLDSIAWKAPKASCAVNPRSAASPAQVRAILAKVTRIRPELTAFFGCLYYAALRPEEAVALHRDSCELPASGWGRLSLTTASPRTTRTWTARMSTAASSSARTAPSGWCPSRPYLSASSAAT